MLVVINYTYNTLFSTGMRPLEAFYAKLRDGVLREDEFDSVAL